MSVKHVHIHSHDRLNILDPAESFSLEVPKLLTNDNPTLQSVALRSAVVPNSMYNVPSGKNVLSYTDVATAPAIRTLTLAPGYYSISQLIAALNAAVPSIAGATLTFTLDAISNRVSFTYIQAAVNKAITFQSDVSTRNLLKLLGYASFTKSVFDYPAAASTVAARAPMMLPHKYIYVCMEDVQSGVACGLNSATGPLRESIFPLPLSVPYNEVIMYDNVNPMFVQYGTSTDGQPLGGVLKFTLRDSAGNVLDNGNADWSATFEFVFRV